MKLPNKFDLKQIENQMRSHLNSCTPNNAKTDYGFNKIIGFVEGPPTLNGEPHLGHVRGRVIKDVWYRYKTLQKFKVIFRAGWDTQGLPVELQAEKLLGLSGSKSENIKRVGIEKIVETCKQLIRNNSEKWVQLDFLLGVSLDHANAYWTFKDDYIEREWVYLKRAYDLGILQEWFRVVAYCPSCQTSLSNAEVNQGYKNLDDPSLFYKVKLTDEDTFMVIWTTMPFTLITDELVGVHPDAEYVYVHIEDKNEVWIVGSNRLDSLMKEFGLERYKILKCVRGKELEGKKYCHPFLDLIPELKTLAKNDKIHFVVAENYVDTSTGSGIVHISPANGEEDFEVAVKRKIPIFVPLDDSASFTHKAGRFAGYYVRDTDKIVIEELKRVNSSIKVGRIKHQYPTCWRSNHRLVWFARREYFYMIDKLGDLPVYAASKIEYFFDSPKNRFLEIIKEKVPWCISRERVWGTPLPIWSCSNCCTKEPFFSRKDILQRASELPDGKDFELHRPWIDRIVIKCLQCGENMLREPFVLDTWHNSGASPYASLTDKEYDELIPVPFLTEGIDQTRGWAYTLLIENVIMNNSPEAPFNSFLFQGHILDEKGNKMSKSLGNVVDATDLSSNNSNDLIRFYLMWKATPIDSINFSQSEMRSRPYQVLSTLYNLHTYYFQNSNYDKFDRMNFPIDKIFKSSFATLPERWIISKLQNTITSITNCFEKCKFNEGVRILEEFLISDLSQTYVPFTRDTIWDDSPSTLERRNVIYGTLAYSLTLLDIVLHPICPFTTNFLYLSCFKSFETILSETWPDVKDYFDHDVEITMELARKIISLSNAARMKAKVKRRWPLSKVIVCLIDTQLLEKNEVKELLKNQVNVDSIDVISIKDITNETKKIRVLHDKKLIHLMGRLRTKRIAPLLKENLVTIMAFFKKHEADIVNRIINEGKYFFELEGHELEITSEDVDVSFMPVENYEMSISEHKDVIIFLCLERNDDLVARGLMKDLARNIQQMRKEEGYVPTDTLALAYISNLSMEEMLQLEDLKKELAFLVRVNSVVMTPNALPDISYKNINLDGREILISIKQY